MIYDSGLQPFSGGFWSYWGNYALCEKTNGEAQKMVDSERIFVESDQKPISETKSQIYNHIILNVQMSDILCKFMQFMR